MFRKRIKSFYYAFQGIQFLFHSQFHSKIHLFFTFAVIFNGLFFKVTKVEWLILFLCVGMVWSLEALNTAVEKIVDLITLESHPKAKHAKDVAAGAVLITSIISAIIGFWIFIPYWYNWLIA